MDDEQELIKRVKEEIAQANIDDFFYEDTFWGLRKLANKKGWKRVKDINLFIVRGLMTQRAYYSVIKKIFPNEDIDCFKKQSKNMDSDKKLPLNIIESLNKYAEVKIDDIFTENEFNLFKNFAKQNNWETVRDIQFEKLLAVKGIGNTRIERIKNKLTTIQRKWNEKHIQVKTKLENEIKIKTMLVPFHKYIPISEIHIDEDIMMQEKEEMLEELEKEKKILYTESGVRYIFKPLMEQIEEIPNERDKTIIKERLAGKTYEEIGRNLKPQISGERVRQCIERIYIRHIVDVEENKYYAYCKKYHLGEESFCKIFHEPKSTYRFLRDMSSGVIGTFKKEFLKMLLTQTEMDEAIEDKICSCCNILKEKELDKLKNVIENKAYSIEEMKQLFESVDIPKAYINKRNLDNLGFYIVDYYVIPKKYDNMNEYMKEKVFDHKIIKIDNINQYYITKYLKEHLIIRISKNEYASVKYLKETTNINEETLKNFENEILEKFEEQEYFSITNVKEKINVENFEEIGIEDSFYESQIEIIKGIIKIQIDHNIIFYKQQFSERANNTTFVEHIVKELKKTSIENLQDYIEEKYKIQIHYEVLRKIVMYSNLYYEPTIQKAYINKETFYDDIFE